MLRQKFSEIFHQAQQSASSHQKYCQLLLNLYKKTDFEDFECEFMKSLHRLFAIEDVVHKQVNVERGMTFAAMFVGATTTSEKPDELNDEESSHPFLIAIIEDVLAYHNLDCLSLRYRSCQFINLVLSSIGADANISVHIWNAIENAMLERTQDNKPNVRLQAVKALMRLQVPLNIDCPVIKTLVSHLIDTSPMVRKEVVDIIAPNPVTIPKLVERVRDTDHTVRLAAFRKFSIIGPRALRIIDRQSIMNSGFDERHEGVKQFFIEDTLPKWLAAYNGDFLKFLTALKLDAYEEDIEHTETVCQHVLEEFFKSHEFTRIVEYLPISEDKTIPIDKLNNESALFWRLLNHYLRKSQKTEDYAEDIVPELIQFANYIFKVYEIKSAKRMENWEFLEYQYILSQLFIMAAEYDISDEVGRQALKKVIVDILNTAKLEHRVIIEIISILLAITPSFDTLSIEICHMMSDIREPLVTQPHTAENERQHEFKLAEYRVKINILTEEKDDAVTNCDYSKAADLKNQLTELTNQVAELVSNYEASKAVVRQPNNDSETLCRCLDILIGILSSPKLNSLTVSLRTCKDEFVMPLQEHDNAEVSLRVYKCITLYCTLDEQLAHEQLKYICTPVILYRLIPNYDKSILMNSIAAVSDFMRLYGIDIFGRNEENTSSSTTASKYKSNANRRLYQISQLDDVEAFDFASITSQDLIDILLDMIDDEIEEIRVQACKALCQLIMDKIAVSSSLMCRLILKWLSPLTEKHDAKLQQCLGNAIMFYAQCIEGSDEILEKAVLPILTSIINAPHTSPLADINIENALGFLAAITSIQKELGYVHSHKNLAFELCYKISIKPDDKCTPLFVKMLHHLELGLEEMDVIKELINQSKIIIEEIIDKVPKRNMQKFLSKLTVLLMELENANIISHHASLQSLDNRDVENVSKRTEDEDLNATDSSRRNSSISSQRKSEPKLLHVNGTRKSLNHKNRNSKPVVNITRLNVSQYGGRKSKNGDGSCSDRTYSDVTVLHTIVEDNSEVGLLADDEEENSIRQTPANETDQKNASSIRIINRGRKKLSFSSIDTPINNVYTKNIHKRNTNAMFSNSNTSSISSGDDSIKGPEEEVDDAMSKMRKLVVNVTPLDIRKMPERKSKNSFSLTNSYDDETILHTIIEDHTEMGILEDEVVSTPTTNASSSSKSSSNRKSALQKVLPNQNVTNSGKGRKRKEKSKGTDSSSQSSSEGADGTHSKKVLKVNCVSGTTNGKSRRLGKKTKHK